MEALLLCKYLLESKMTEKTFTAKGYTAKDVLELVHFDLHGPMTIQTRSGYVYFITFIDEYSRFGYIHLIHHKSEAFDIIMEDSTS